MSFAEYLAEYGLHWVVEFIILILVVSLIIANWKRFMRFSASKMIPIAVALWLGGIGLYVVGFAFEGTAHSLISVLFRSSIASLKLFIADNELTEVSGYYKDNAIYMLLFALVQFCAFSLTIILVLNTLGSRFGSYVKLFMEKARCGRKDRRSYIFWDINMPSVTLAKDIRDKDKESRIIFICPFGANSLGEKLEITQLLNSRSISAEVGASAIDQIDNVLTVHIPKEATRGLRISWLKKILESSSRLDFFFLTDNTDMNITLAETLNSGYQLDLNEKTNVGIHILTNSSARQTVNEEYLLLHEGEKANFNWSFVNIPSLAVESLKFHTDNYPACTFKDEDIHDGKIDGEFNSWILGLGETGTQMFRFLYEFSMLEGLNQSVIGRNFRIFDNKAGAHTGDLFKECPGIISSGCIDIDDTKIGTTEFWDKLSNEADSLNCISIALGSDETDLKLARDIYRHLTHFSADPKHHLKIFVRIYSPEYIRPFATLAGEYNANKAKVNIEIVPYGGVTDVFKENIILKNTVQKFFKAFNHSFDAIRGKNEGLTVEECWKADFNMKKFTSRYDNVTVALDELERRKAQCQSSSFFIGTLMRISGTDVKDKEKIEELLHRIDSTDGMSNKLEDVLIRDCYLREQASHQLLGFIPCSNEYAKADRDKAVTHKMTPYLLPWNEASKETRSLFKDLMKTSLHLAKEYTTE